MSVETSVSVGYSGRRRFERFPGRWAAGYDLIARDNRNSTWVAGHAVPNVDNWGRQRGWFVVDAESGEVILGLGRSTALGDQLADTCFILAELLESNRTTEH